MQFNEAILFGNLTRDPDVKQIEKGTFAVFSIAVNRRYKTMAGEQKEEVSFFRIHAYGSIADLVGKCLAKGSPCMVKGRLKQERWDDEKGEKRNRIVVVAENIQLIPRIGRKEEEQNAEVNPYESDELPAI